MNHRPKQYYYFPLPPGSFKKNPDRMFYAMGPHITEKYIPSPKNTQKKKTPHVFFFIWLSYFAKKVHHADLPSGMEKSPPPIPDLPSVQAVQAIEIPGHLESPWMGRCVSEKRRFFVEVAKTRKLREGGIYMGYMIYIYICIEHKKYIYI